MPNLPTNAAFRDTLQAMTVTGVTVHLDYPPAGERVTPFAFCGLPSSALGDYVMSCTNEDKMRTMQYMICAEAYAQSSNEANYELLAGLIDNLETALDTALATTANFHQYEISTGTIEVAGTAYWGITATVTIRSV